MTCERKYKCENKVDNKCTFKMNVHYLHLFSTKVFCLLNFSCSIICVIYMIRMYVYTSYIWGKNFQLSTFLLELFDVCF